MRRLARQQTGAALVLVLLGVLIFSALSAFIILAVDRHTGSLTEVPALGQLGPVRDKVMRQGGPGFQGGRKRRETGKQHSNSNKFHAGENRTGRGQK